MLRASSDGTGFQVDPEELSGVAGRLGQAYDDFTTAITDFHGLECYCAGMFGDSNVGAAWVAVNSAWAEELTAAGAALAELIHKVSTTAQLYQETEASITATIAASITASSTGTMRVR